MSFTQPCFIRKNTPELIKKLEELGYNRHPSYGDNGQYLYLNRGFYHTNVVGYSEEIERMIDCGTNEELFIALAALRNDTDVNQWFVMDVEEYMDINQGDWFIATDRNKGKHIGTQIEPMYCHKASVEEIIEHFFKIRNYGF